MMDTTKPNLTRRRLLQHTAIGTGAATALALVPRPLTAMLGGRRPEPIPSIQDDRIKALVQRGLDAAKSAGAQYAEVRMSYTQRRFYPPGPALVRLETESIHWSVRALIDGYWGFSASPVWTPEEITRLGREAARQAKANTLGKVRETDLPALTTIPNGHWETPVELDPFLIDPADINDYLGYFCELIRLELAPFYGNGVIPAGEPGGANFQVWRQSKAFGSTDGAYCTQRITRSTAGAGLQDLDKQIFGTVIFTPVGAGWEYFRNQDPSHLIERVMEDVAYNQEMGRLPVKPVDIGRYTTVFDAKDVAYLLSVSLGNATHVDRAFGYLANSTGTSYLNDPEAMLGTFAIGHPSLTVTANRNEAGGLATVQWDEEGVEPTPFTMIDRGVVSEFHTSREGAGWLKSCYERLGRPFRSNGSAYSETAYESVGINTANLVMQPADNTMSHQDLEASIDNGLSISGLKPRMDFQLTSGFDVGGNPPFDCFEIRKGKRIARMMGAGIMFRTPELWKGLLSIGGRGSEQRIGIDPVLSGFGGSSDTHSVTAVPIVVKDLTIIDPKRR